VKKAPGPELTLPEILADFAAHGSPDGVAGMARFGIVTAQAFGVSTGDVRRLAKRIGKNHRLAVALWKQGSFEARALAFMIEDPRTLTAAQMDRWTAQFDNWATCDGCCLHLFVATPFAVAKALQYAADDREFVKRAGLTLIACLAVHDKAGTSPWGEFLTVIRRESSDPRNYVKKAANWALRQIGKRDLELNRQALTVAEELAQADNAPARWIGKDAVRELRSEAVQERLAAKAAGLRNAALVGPPSHSSEALRAKSGDPAERAGGSGLSECRRRF
jgi:3-methyladenine DNA glycosylase AlkD